MTGTQTKALDRAQAQCDRILNAAEQCFIQYGFHAASMAKISEVSEMSPGLIYRYFENKAAIIQGIVERQLKRMRHDIEALEKGSDLVSMILDMFVGWSKGKRRGISPLLYLELIAEAARDPEIAKSVHIHNTAADRGLGNWLEQIAKKSGHNPTEDEIQQSLLALRCFMDGLVIRAVKEPDLTPEQIKTMLKKHIPYFLPS